MSAKPKKSLNFQRAENEARRERGLSSISIDLFCFERWILNEAYDVTGVSPGQFLRLAALEPDFDLDRLADDIAGFSYRREEAEKVSLADIDAVNQDIEEYSRSIRSRLLEIEEERRADWKRLEGVRS